MEESNVNRLNGVENFGHGMEGVEEVVAGVTDVPTEQREEVIPTEKEDVSVDEVESAPETEVKEDKDKNAKGKRKA